MHWGLQRGRAALARAFKIPAMASCEESPGFTNRLPNEPSGHRAPCGGFEVPCDDPCHKPLQNALGVYPSATNPLVDSLAARTIWCELCVFTQVSVLRQEAQVNKPVQAVSERTFRVAFCWTTCSPKRVLRLDCPPAPKRRKLSQR